MDVFTLDGEYVGTVLYVSSLSPPAPLSRARERGRPRDAAGFSGESLGPAPTASVGNSGPASQGRATGFGAAQNAGDGESSAAAGQMVLYRWLVAQQWHLSRPSLRRLPLALVQAVSLERVILSVSAEELARR